MPNSEKAKLNQNSQVNTAKKTIVGTKYLAIVSATFWIGAFTVYACSTSFMIWLMAALSDVFVTWMRTAPFARIVPP